MHALDACVPVVHQQSYFINKHIGMLTLLQYHRLTDWCHSPMWLIGDERWWKMMRSYTCMFILRQQKVRNKEVKAPPPDFTEPLELAVGAGWITPRVHGSMNPIERARVTGTGLRAFGAGVQVFSISHIDYYLPLTCFSSFAHSVFLHGFEAFIYLIICWRSVVP